MPATNSPFFIDTQYADFSDVSVTSLDISTNNPLTPGNYAIITIFTSLGATALGTIVGPTGFLEQPGSPSATRQIISFYRQIQPGDSIGPYTVSWTNAVDAKISINELQNGAPSGNPFMSGGANIVTSAANHAFASLTPTRFGALPWARSIATDSTAVTYKSPNTNDWCQSVVATDTDNTITTFSAYGPATNDVVDTIQQTPTVTATVTTIEVTLDQLAPPPGPIANTQAIAINSGASGGATTATVQVTDNGSTAALTATIANTALATVALTSGGGNAPGPLTYTITATSNAAASGSTTLTISDGTYSCVVEVFVLVLGTVSAVVIGGGQNQQLQVNVPGSLGTPIDITSSNSAIAYTQPTNTPSLNPAVTGPSAVVNIVQAATGSVTFSVVCGPSSASVSFSSSAPIYGGPRFSSPRVRRPLRPGSPIQLQRRPFPGINKATFVSRLLLPGVAQALQFAANVGGSTLFYSINPADRSKITNNGNGADAATLAAYQQLTESGNPVFEVCGDAGWCNHPASIPAAVAGFLSIQGTYGGLAGILFDVEIGSQAAWVAGGSARGALIDQFVTLMQTLYTACSTNHGGSFPLVGFTSATFMCGNFGTIDSVNSMYKRTAAIMDFSVCISYNQPPAHYLALASSAGIFAQNTKPIWAAATTTAASAVHGIGYYGANADAFYTAIETTDALMLSYAGSLYAGIALENMTNSLKAMLP